MRVICVDNKNYPLSLELNKEYEVLEKGDFFILIDKNLEDCEYPKKLFEIKKNTDRIKV